MNEHERMGRKGGLARTPQQQRRVQSIESVTESIQQKADRIRLGHRLSAALADMLVRDPRDYDIQGQEAIPRGVPQGILNDCR
jgi:hypothetical protein